jgi:hypothetical protein
MYTVTEYNILLNKFKSLGCNVIEKFINVEGKFTENSSEYIAVRIAYVKYQNYEGKFTIKYLTSKYEISIQFKYLKNEKFEYDSFIKYKSSDIIDIFKNSNSNSNYKKFSIGQYKRFIDDIDNGYIDYDPRNESSQLSKFLSFEDFIRCN